MTTHPGNELNDGDMAEREAPADGIIKTAVPGDTLTSLDARVPTGADVINSGDTYSNVNLIPTLGGRRDFMNDSDRRYAYVQPNPYFSDVKEFHQKFGLLCFDEPGHLTKRKLTERFEFLMEELLEFGEAAGLEVATMRGEEGDYVTEITDCGEPQDLADQADALVDLVYVALGTAVMLGLPWQELWDDVQRANMAKVPGVTHRGHAVDVKKPPGWVGPKGLAILEANGYNAEDMTERDDA